ncbi:GGDEF domain-containing protein [Marinobacter sp. C2H3]|uniref:GGDEF domain-containing protein n=1 Tax=Marinobacter sp. C2H3 TaxID=3119003 RepID=UPI00300E99A0
MKHDPTPLPLSQQRHQLATLRQAWGDWTGAPGPLVRLSRRLSTSLSLEAQLGIFAEELSAVVPFDALNYRHTLARRDFVFATGLGGPHRAEYTLNLEGERLGSLTITRRKRFLDEELEAIECLVSVLICPLRNACQYAVLERTARTDALTGIANKRALDEDLARTQHLSDRHEDTYSLVLIDLDHFKAVNDKHGHPAGDHVLRLAAERMTEALRVSDTLYRFGGEEFAALLPHANADQAAEVATRLRAAVAGAGVEIGSQQISVTASCGIAAHLGGESAAQWLARADEALYRAKRDGRDRIRVSATLGSAG